MHLIDEFTRAKKNGIHFDRNVLDVIPASLQNKEQTSILQNKEKPQKTMKSVKS